MDVAALNSRVVMEMKPVPVVIGTKDGAKTEAAKEVRHVLFYYLSSSSSSSSTSSSSTSDNSTSISCMIVVGFAAIHGKL